MRMRLGMMAGLAAGYVLGTKAGRERYEEIREQWNKLMGTEQAQQLQSQVREVADRAGSKMEEKASEGVEKVSEMVGSTGSGSKKTSPTPNDPGIVLPPT